MELRSGSVVGKGLLRPEHRPLFEEGVRLLFSRWTALCLAVENQWGGSNSAQKAESLLMECLEWFYRKKEHHADELEEELDDAILHDFNVEAEDNSPKVMAESLVSLYQECLQGNFTSVERWRAQAVSGAAKSQKQVVDHDGTVMEGDDEDTSSSGEDMSDDDDDDAMDEDSEPPAAVPFQPPLPKPAPVVDEDGFTMVQKPGRRHR